ncbi:MAG: guanylate kinase [Gammaproteobacteria bacterium]
MTESSSSETANGLLIVVSAPSGAGKTTAVNALLQRDPALSRTISHTTRAPRGEERDGVDYHYVSADHFEAMDQEAQFLEQAGIYGNRYGTSRQEVERIHNEGRDAVLVLDWQGARSVRAAMERVHTVFLLPPSLVELRRRLTGRGEDSEEVIARRLAAAQSEIVHAGEYDCVVINDNLDEAVTRLATFVAACRAGLPAACDDCAPLIAELMRT